MIGFSFFVARRFFKNIGKDKRQASNPTITIATAGVVIGLAVMIVSVSIILGFKSEITKKVEGFGSHIEVLDINAITAPDGFPVQTDGKFLNALKSLPLVKSVDRIVQKNGIFKTRDDFMGITLKGLPADYDTSFISQSLVEGRLPDFKKDNGNEILISRPQANSLRLKTGDRVFAYFFEESIKMRRFTISGIYQSNMGLFDKNIVIANLSTVERLNHWDSTRASLLEVRLHEFAHIDRAMPDIQKLCAKMNRSESAKTRQALSIKEHYSQVFAWLDLLDFNLLVILVLMIAVSGFTMISGLLILILERTATIGVLKVLGANNTTIRHIFLHFSALITIRGLLIGNALAFVLLGIQYQWGIVRLDPATYYVDTVPIAFDALIIVLINLSTLLLTTLALVAPSYMISRIQPAKAIRFD